MIDEDNNLEEPEKKNKPLSQHEIKFFSTNDKFFTNLDNEIIIKFIIQKYPNLNVNNSDLVIKKTIIELINDKLFVESILKHFSISLHEFFKIFYKDYGNLFKGPYLKRIKTALKLNNYF